MTEYKMTLSTTEPNNYVGLIKLRQGDIASQSIQATITANGQLFNFDRLAVFFNAVLPNGNVVRDKVTEVNYANSKLNYVVADSFLQEVAQVTAWFSFENGEKIIDSTKNFQYSVIGGWKECIPQGNYIYELSEIQREIEEIISNKDFTTLLSELDFLKTNIAYLDNNFKTIKADLYNSFNEKLATMRLSPEAFANVAALQAKYPQGNDQLNVTVDTGHLWIWYNGAWKDSGQYQTVGLDREALNLIEEEVLSKTEEIKASLYNQQQQLYDHNNKLNQAADRINDQQTELDKHESELKLDRTDIQDIRGVGSLKNIELLDENGNRLVDNSGVVIGGQRWLVNTDKTLSQDDLPADAKAVGDALVTKPDAYGIPILYLYGDGIPSLKSKADSLSNGISFRFPSFNISGNLDKIKVQGQSSTSLAKKNYTLQFDHSVEIFPEYGKQNKYVIKADMTDFSHVRNTGCAKIWGKVRETRIRADDAIKLNDTDYLVDNLGNHIVGESDPQLSIGGTYGAIDGFPIAVYINDRYWGLYDFTIQKDACMAKMTKKDGNAIVSANYTQLDKPIILDGSDMDIEFCGSKDTDWVVSSINTLVDTLTAHYTSATDFDNAISSLLDIDSAIDYYVYSAAIDNSDGVGRNYLLQTWNGKKWYVAAYDLDYTFGRSFRVPALMSPLYNGDDYYNGGITLANLASGNRIFYQLWKLHKEDIIARYKELVAGPLSSGAVSTLLTNYAYKIPNALLNQEDKTWPQTQLSGISNLSQIRWWYMEHINFLNSLVANN